MSKNIATPKRKTLKCLNPECDNPTRTRGLCLSCYGTAARLVRDKRVTWEALEEAGKALPAKREHKEVQNWLLEE